MTKEILVELSEQIERFAASSVMNCGRRNVLCLIKFAIYSGNEHAMSAAYDRALSFASKTASGFCAGGSES